MPAAFTVQAKRYHCSLVEQVLILFSAVKLNYYCKGPLCYVHLAIKLCVVFVICLRVIQKVVQSVIVYARSDAVILCSKSIAHAFLLHTYTSFILKKDHFLAFRHCTKYCFVS